MALCGQLGYDGLARGELLHGALVCGGRLRDALGLGVLGYHDELGYGALVQSRSSASIVGGHARALQCVQEVHRDGSRGVAQENDDRDEVRQSRKLHGMSGVHGPQRVGTRQMCDEWGSRATDAPNGLVRDDLQGSLSKARDVDHGLSLELRGTQKLLEGDEHPQQGDVAQEHHDVRRVGGGLLRALDAP